MTREEAIKELKEMIKYEWGTYQTKTAKIYVKALNMAIKALEQEPKTGHWIEHPHEAGPCWEYSRYECSECHEWAEDDSDYCPDCGAKMVEPQESEGRR